MNLIPSNFKTILFSILAFTLLGTDAFARTLTVNVTSNFGGRVYYSDNSPLSGESLQVDARIGTSSVTNVSWDLDSNGAYPTNIKSGSTKILDIPAGSSYTVTINYTFTVNNPWGLKNFTFSTQKTKTFNDLSPTATDQTRSTGEIDLHNDFITPFNVPTTIYGTVNNQSLTGVSNFTATSAPTQDGYIKLNWNSEGTSPTNHWIVATEASLPEAPCNTGFKLGGTTATGFSVKYFPEKKNTAYKFKICPIYYFSTSYCGTSGMSNPVPCQARATALAVVDTKLETLSQIQVANNFSPSISLPTNWSEVLGESWYYSTTTGNWFYFVPKSTAYPNEGKLYINTGNDPQSTFVANRANDEFQVELISSATGYYRYQAIHEDLPISIKVPIALGNIPNVSPADEARLLEWDIDTSGSKLASANWSQVFNEKWLFSEKQIYTNSTSTTEKKKNWLYMLPSGATYRWDGVSSGSNLTGTFYAKYPPMYYNQLEQTVDLQESWIQRIYGFETTSANFSYDYNGNKNPSFTHYYEKWVRSRRNMQWYYILPSGQIYHYLPPYPILDGDKLAINGIGFSSYRDPSTELINFPY